ncbi:MAG: glycosyltransferase [Planctomycetota bacterium]|jgi:glycosyltransferase involved in cell wall biosynthesis
MHKIIHIAASRFFGGPERQMLELGRSLPANLQSVFVSFSEGGLCQAFLDQARRNGFPGLALKHDTPHLAAALRELTRLLGEVRADLLCCHGYKANLLGLMAARRLGIPVISVSRGWTGETFRVRAYEFLDRLVLRRTDKVVCVSEGQAKKVRAAGVPNHKITVIRNAIRAERFDEPRGEYRQRLEDLFPQPPNLIVGAAGRLSPEKGFAHLVEAAAEVALAHSSVGFVLFGEGQLRNSLVRQIREKGLEGRFILGGFCSDFDQYLPHLDVVVLPSLTEGLPNVALEAFAAGVPLVATAAGGTPEVVEDGQSGYLVPPGDSVALARRMSDVLASDAERPRMGSRGRQRILKDFTFAKQAEQYLQLVAELTVEPVLGADSAA